MATDSEGVILRWWDEIWSRGNLSLADDLHTADFTDHDPGQSPGAAMPRGDEEEGVRYRSAFQICASAWGEHVLSVDDHVISGGSPRPGARRARRSRSRQSASSVSKT